MLNVIFLWNCTRLITIFIFVAIYPLLAPGSPPFVRIALLSPWPPSASLCASASYVSVAGNHRDARTLLSELACTQTVKHHRNTAPGSSLYSCNNMMAGLSLRPVIINEKKAAPQSSGTFVTASGFSSITFMIEQSDCFSGENRLINSL